MAGYVEDAHEAIYNLLPKQEKKQVKAVMHKSSFDPSKCVPYSTFSGTPGGCLYGKRARQDPRNFLRKGEGSVGTKSKAVGLDMRNRPKSAKMRETEALKHGGEKRRIRPVSAKPAIPKADDAPIMGLKGSKNYITANAVNAILSKPKQLHQEPISYLNKEDYGRVPEYLQHVKDEIIAENDMIDSFVKEQMGINDIVKNDCLPMPEQERLELLDGLKSKWDSVNAQYQKLCHQTFFEHNRLEQKRKLEKSLDQIETDIETVSHGNIFVQL